MDKDDKVSMTVSPVVRQDGRQKIFVQFEEKESGKSAEAIIPGCVFISYKGFSDDELDGLKKWLSDRQSEVLAKAQSLSIMNAFLGINNDSDKSGKK